MIIVRKKRDLKLPSGFRLRLLFSTHAKMQVLSFAKGIYCSEIVASSFNGSESLEPPTRT